jgi:RNA polymerase subunit RPABC4/transcription elongation factor Spt4
VTAQPASSVTHGDLTVGPSNSPYIIAPGSNSQQVYYQGGNVTVLPGGQLYIEQTVFEFVQYIGSTGSVSSRLSHIYTFDDQGSVWLESSALTADLGVLNAFPKVTVNVSAPGQLYVNSSSLRFAGTLSVYGAGADAWLNSSVLEPNTENALLPNTSVAANEVATNDSLYSPTLSVLGGGQLTLAGTQESHTYADNWTQSGAPEPAPLTDAIGATIDSTHDGSFAAFATSSNPEALVRDALYRTVTAGSISVDYTATVDEQSTTGNAFIDTGSANLGTVLYPAAGTESTITLPPAALAQINAEGVPAFLQSATSGGITVNLGVTNASAAVTLSQVQIDLVAGASFNITVNGTGSILTAVDSSLDVNWYPVPPFPMPSTAPPFPEPWLSQKVVVDDHAQAFLANLSIQTAPNPQNTTDISAILPDSTSEVYFYRWMVIPVQGAGTQPVAGASAQAFYSYDLSQLNNATATRLNDLAASDPNLMSYTNAWDAAHNVTGYGQTDPVTGDATLLLASGNLTSGDLQDGQFLGTYHIVVSVAGGRAGPPEWFTGSVAAYPNLMTPASGDVQSPTIFPLYRPALSVGVADVTVGVVNATSNTNDTLAIGEATNFTLDVSNIGTGAVGTYNVTLEAYRQGVNATVLDEYNASTPLGVGASLNLTIPWRVNETILGIPHPAIHETFLAIVLWNKGTPPIGGLAEASVNKTIAPSYIGLSFSGPTGNLLAGSTYLGSLTLSFSGNQSAWVNVSAVGAAGTYLLSTAEMIPGTDLTIEMSMPTAMANGVYTVDVSAYHQDRVAYDNITAEFKVGPTSSPSTPWYDQKIIGILPLWLLLGIVAAVVIGLVAALLVFQRQAKGKLVECGECGNLIPEDATTCPKCGAEFETDLVRCSRCGSTIPANSQVCPECAAQLLGKGETETTDPERQGYGDYIERFRADARKELGPNYNEGAFWDWWKRQSTYLPFSQWKLQQAQGSRAGMTAPPEGAEPTDVVLPAVAPSPVPPPPKKGGGAAPPAVPPPAAPPARAPPATPRGGVPPGAAGVGTPPLAATSPPAAAAAPPAPMKACSNCGKEIPPEYLVCPFCGAVTQ